MNFRRSFKSTLALAALLTLLAAFSGAHAAAPIVVKTPDVPRPATAPLGVNLEQIVDYAHSMMFVDLVKSARAFGTADAPWDGKSPVDENGWPTADAGVVLAADAPLASGDYAFACTGRCEVSAVACNAKVKLQSYDRDKNLTTATITLDEKADKLFLAFKKTTGGVKNIRVLRPGYPLTTDQVFTREFLNAIAPFSTLRLMDFTRTNETEVKEWDQRAKLTDALQSTKKGAAWEYGIMLANQTGKDLWINVPVQASDDYVKQLAQLLKKTLNKDRAVYVEYSNEVWNTIFPQFHFNYAAGKAEVAAGNSPLNDGGKDANTYFWAWKRVAKRLVEISNIFKAVYAEGGSPGAINTTVRPVLASQSAIPVMARIQLEFVAKNYGAPAKFFYGLAGAPYIGPDDKVGKQDDATVDQLLDNAAGSAMATIKNVMLQYQTIARYYRLHALCYEGGPAFEGEHSTEAKVAASRDPRIQKLIVDYLNAWYGAGGELFMYFDLAGGYSKYGCWGLTEDIRKPSPKTQAIAQVKAAPLPTEIAGIGIPGTVMASEHVASSGGGIEKTPDGGKHLAFLKEDFWFDYLLNVKSSGDYVLKIETASGVDTAAVEVLLSSQSIGTINCKNTGDWHQWADSDPISLRLEKGQLVLRLRIVKPGLNIRSISIEKKQKP